MLALRLTRGSHPAVQLRRLLVAVASAGTGFLLLCTLGYAMSHPDSPAAAALRLAWCATPLAATVYFAVAVARTDPATKPRPGLSAIGLGPGRLMAISATTTALACSLGSMLALLFFLHLRGDLNGMPFDGAAAEFLASDTPSPPRRPHPARHRPRDRVRLGGPHPPPEGHLPEERPEVLRPFRRLRQVGHPRDLRDLRQVRRPPANGRP